MKASIIVLSWNGVDYLPGCLESLLCQDFRDSEIIIVDNGSTDRSAELVETQFPTTRLIRNERNLGFAAGNNVGLAAATGDVLVLLNQDTRVRPDWLAHLLHGVTSDPRVGIGGCKILYPDEQTIQHAGGIIRLPLAFPEHLGYRQRDDGRWDEQREVDYVTGAAIAFRRDVLEAIGPLDEGFYPAYYEDVDLCARARAAGYTVTYFPRASLVHLEASSFGWNSQTYVQHMHRGRMRYLLKHTQPNAFLNHVVAAERERLHSVESPIERLALWEAYRHAWGQFGELVKASEFVAAPWQEWTHAQSQVETALGELRERVFVGPSVPRMSPSDPASLADFHCDRLRGKLRHTRPTDLVTEFIPAERTRWLAESPTVQQTLTDLYRELAPCLDRLLPAAYPGETLLARLAWKEQLESTPGDSAHWTAKVNRLRDRLEQLENPVPFHEHLFVSDAPLIGPLIVRLRTLWHDVAARWAIRTLSDQQQAINLQMAQTLREIKEALDSIERTAIENDRAITQLGRRVAMLEGQHPGNTHEAGFL
jgi:GT2 family glycosyltransferase